jgi:hypothetical protein
MKNNNLKEISVAVILLVLLLLLLNPLHFWMPNMMLGAILVAAIVAFGVFATFILQEKVVDEREASHRAASGRAAYLAGSAVLILGILLESLHHHVDPWLFVALVAMVVAKIAVRVYTDRIH